MPNQCIKIVATFSLMKWKNVSLLKISIGGVNKAFIYLIHLENLH